MGSSRHRLEDHINRRGQLPPSKSATSDPRHPGPGHSFDAAWGTAHQTVAISCREWTAIRRQAHRPRFGPHDRRTMIQGRRDGSNRRHHRLSRPETGPRQPLLDIRSEYLLPRLHRRSHLAASRRSPKGASATLYHTCTPTDESQIQRGRFFPRVLGHHCEDAGERPADSYPAPAALLGDWKRLTRKRPSATARRDFWPSRSPAPCTADAERRSLRARLSTAARRARGAEGGAGRPPPAEPQSQSDGNAPRRFYQRALQVLAEAAATITYAPRAARSCLSLDPFHTAYRTNVSRSQPQGRQRRLRPWIVRSTPAHPLPPPSRQVGRYWRKCSNPAKNWLAYQPSEPETPSKCRTRDAARHRRSPFGSWTRAQSIGQPSPTCSGPWARHYRTQALKLALAAHPQKNPLSKVSPSILTDRVSQHPQ